MKKTLLIFAVFLWSGLQIALAQSRPVRGKVTDANGKPIEAASVSVKNAESTAITDEGGNFQIDVPDANNTLVIEAIGYDTKEVDAGDGGKALSINMAQSENTLDETVITANAIKREKRSLGYSTTTIDNETLTEGGNVSPLNSLAGKVAGLNVTTTSNSPGSSSRIVLRGGSSMTGNNQALIVVDGVPINNSGFGTAGNIGNLSNQVDYGNRGNDVNPNDIASITILKGPAATALYGSAGSNGAIMITTKSGASANKKMAIEINTGVSFQSVLKFPDFQNQYGQGNIYEGVYDDRRENFSWGEPFNGQLRPWGQVIYGEQKVKPYSAIPDNVKDFFQLGATANNSFSIGGGDTNTSYRLSLSSVNSQSPLMSKNYNKYGASFGGRAQLSNKFYTSVNATYTKVKSDLPSFGQGSASVLDNLYQMPRDIPITELRDYKNDIFNTMNYTDTAGIARYGYYGAYADNPYYALQEYKNINKVDRFYGNFIVGYNILPWLQLEDRVSGDFYSDRRYQSAPKVNSVGFDDFWSQSPKNLVGRYAEDLINVNNIYNDIMLSGTKDFGDFNVRGLIGQNTQQSVLSENYTSTNEDGGLVVPDYYNLSNSNGPVLSDNSISKVRRFGFYGDFSAGYKNMLFAGVNFRNDWSSTVKNSYFYYGANASFVASELFNQDMRKYWNYSKFRISYGRVGNDANPYLWANSYVKANPSGDFGSTIFPLGSVPGFTYSGLLANPDIKPEFTNEFEIGTEQSFFDNRIWFDVAYYQKNSKDQIVPVSYSSASGFSTQFINTGLVTNKGVEIALRLAPVKTADFRWEVYGTYTKNVNKVVSIKDGTNQISIGAAINGMQIVAATGLPYGTFYTDDFLKTTDGKYVVDSASGLPLLDNSGAKFFGSYLPKFQASWGTTLNWKGLSLSVLFDTKQGGQFYSRTRDILAFVGTSAESGNREDQIWPNSVYKSADGQYVANTTEYSPYQFYTTQANRPGSWQLIDASYVKLREVNLSYILPAQWFQNTFIGGITASLFANNLFLWTPKENQFTDPELSSNGAGNAQGFEFSTMPSLRSYGFNIKVNF